ncbi:MAG: DUF1566 domain-containing protein [Gemmatimonadota bacterium]|nr:MAG: DUF1566 domain-containing protein [Gemmatimonadota bacterium]
MRRRHIVFAAVVLVVFSVWVLALSEYAGDSDPTYPPGSTSSYSLEDIYNRLVTGAEDGPRPFTEPTDGLGTATMHTLNDILGEAPAVDEANGATAADVLSGKTFWGLTSGEWGTQTGTAAAGSDVLGAEGSIAFPIPDGVYSGKTATAQDGDLLEGNIRSGIDIFGVSGTLIEASGAARVPKTGVTKCLNDEGLVIPCEGTGQDGEYQLGVLPEWSPSTGVRGAYTVYGFTGARFTDHGDDTVTDNWTRLMWTKGAPHAIHRVIDALNFCNDFSFAGYDDWRLPNVNELHSLIDLTQSGPALPAGHPFSVFTGLPFCTSTLDPGEHGFYYVSLSDGDVGVFDLIQQNDNCSVWPVRGGQ